EDDILARLREICLALPDTSERLSHGAPTFFVREKKAFLMVMNDQQGDGRFCDLVRCARGNATDARRCRSGQVLRPLVRRASRVARRPPRPWPRLGRVGRPRRGRPRGAHMSRPVIGITTYVT